MNQAIMNPNKAFWEKGDFTEIAALMRESGEAGVKSLGITRPLRVLDLGCRDGTTAVPLARMGLRLLESTSPGTSKPGTNELQRRASTNWNFKRETRATWKASPTIRLI